MTPTLQKSMEAIESQDFYELMQAYRHTPMVQQEDVVARFEAVKSFVKNLVKTSHDEWVREENAACAAIAKVGIGKEPLSEASEEAQVIFDAIIARQTHQKQVSG